MSETQRQPTENANEGTQRQPRRRPARRESGGRFGFSQGGGGLVEVLRKSDLPDDVEALIDPELNRDHILGNLNEDEVRYRRFSLWNNKEMVLGAFPPKESYWQGERRKEAAALDDGRTALTQEQIHWLRDAFDAAYARVSRSRGGWQQDKLADQQTERREVVEDATEDRGGFLSKLIG